MFAQIKRRASERGWREGGGDDATATDWTKPGRKDYKFSFTSGYIRKLNTWHFETALIWRRSCLEKQNIAEHSISKHPQYLLFLQTALRRDSRPSEIFSGICHIIFNQSNLLIAFNRIRWSLPLAGAISLILPIPKMEPCLYNCAMKLPWPLTPSPFPEEAHSKSKRTESLSSP